MITKPLPRAAGGVKAFAIMEVLEHVLAVHLA